jgi:predicted peptidase
MRLTLSALDSLKHEFRIDTQRIYVIGLSMGGHGVWDLVTRFPKMFAAAIPVCSAGDPAKAAKIVGVPIWCFHGAADPVVGVAYARTMITALRKAGGTPKYTEYPGVGHDSYRNAFKEAELLPWLFAQRRKD